MSPASKAAQDFVAVKEIRNGIITLKDGSYRSIVMCSSVNFSLKSEDEQRAIIGGFQTFLNTLDFSVEIVVNSRKMDIRPYLAVLSEKGAAQKTELMRIQLREYLSFIRNLTESTNIMTKTFYVVVPYAPTGMSAASSALPFLGHEKKPAAERGSFEEHRVQLEQRVALVIGGLASTGVRGIPLGTEEAIELLYRAYNPGELENPIRLADESRPQDPSYTA
ncbi:hypothetical protein KGQ55_03110 [Patescibacteria group bacterium]|nr:hypothetical protein [Patescibacteria group bacterium]